MEINRKVKADGRVVAKAGKAAKKATIKLPKHMKSGIKPAVSPKPNTIRTELPIDDGVLKGWSAIRLRDEDTGRIVVEFTFPNGDGSEGRREISGALTPREMCRELRGFTTELPALPKTAAQFIEKVIAAAPPTFHIKASKPGWKLSSNEANGRPAAFVTPHFIIPPTAPYRWGGLASSPIGRTKGTLESWQENVASFAESSRYLAFAICCAAAAPLARFSNLPELAVFNLVGPSSVGKTTVARAAMSAVAPPDAIKSWDLKNRALEEAAAQHNDLLLVLNGAERLPEKERVILIDRIIHMLPEGKSTGRSVVVQEHLPNEAWTNVILSTSNKKGSEMVAARRGWDEQDSVRFIDIPVSSIAAGGIFDRLDPASRGSSSELVKALESNLVENYGAFLPAWLEYLSKCELSGVLLDAANAYLEKTKPDPGIEERIASKFALIYAAGELAREAGLLPWEDGLIFKSVRVMHVRSIRFRKQPSEALRKALATLASHLRGPACREITSGTMINVDEQAQFLGVRTRLKGSPVIGIRIEGLKVSMAGTKCA